MATFPPKDTDPIEYYTRVPVQWRAGRRVGESAPQKTVEEVVRPSFDETARMVLRFLGHVPVVTGYFTGGFFFRTKNGDVYRVFQAMDSMVVARQNTLTPADAQEMARLGFWQ